MTTDLHDNDFNVFQVSFKILLWRIFFFSVKKYIIQIHMCQENKKISIPLTSQQN